MDSQGGGNVSFCPVILAGSALSYYNSSSVCLSACSPTPPRSFDGSSPNLVGVCRWASELPLRGSFLKRSMGQQVNRSNVIFFWADDTRLRPHRCKRWRLLPSKRHTASKSLIPSTGIFTSFNKSQQESVYVYKLRIPTHLVFPIWSTDNSYHYKFSSQFR